MSGFAPVVVPDPQADWETIWHFALSINGYKVQDITDLTFLERAIRDDWDRAGTLPGDLFHLRLALFILQRQHRHWGWDPHPGTDAYVRALVARIADVSGGSVPGPHELEQQDAEEGAVVTDESAARSDHIDENDDPRNAELPETACGWPMDPSLRHLQYEVPGMHRRPTVERLSYEARMRSAAQWATEYGQDPQGWAAWDTYL